MAGMGPRNRRRVAGGAIGVAVVAALAAAFWLTGPASNHDGSAGDDGSGGGTPVVVRAQDVTGRLVYGMTKQQVQRRIGKPAKTLRDQTGADCWQYDTQRVFKAFNGDTHVENAVRVCFVDGSYSVNYTETDGKWDYVRPKITVG